MITELQNICLFVRIDGGHLIAIEAKYYLKCLTATSLCKIVMEEFFAHETHAILPTFPLRLEKLHLPSTKSDLLKCHKQPELSDPSPTYLSLHSAGWCCNCSLSTNQSY